MTQVDIKYLEDKDGNPIAPITHVNAVRDSNGDTLPEILDRDYPTTSKTPSEGSSEVSLVTRGEKYNYDKVNNATDVSGASGIGANLKYILLNGTTGEFEAALGSYVEEKVRSALGGLLHNLNKASVSSANLDVACIEHIPADANAGTPESYDFGSLSAAQLASVLGGCLYFESKQLGPGTHNLSLGEGILFVENYSGQVGALFYISFWGDMKTIATSNSYEYAPTRYFDVSKTPDSGQVTITHTGQASIDVRYIFIGRKYGA